ncbi:Paired box protein Pax-4 [Labeo rohita]|uniref:Paired box protein Pax-4 n=1 Tax=Labeo rohita TaxID=84645 RepID=A0ABQ8LET7_LABRO|nr:Paired box protein Pax-4 [Labeo rohita]
MSISRDLNVPVSTVRNINRRFIAHGTVANLPRCERKSKINEKLQRRIVQMEDKEPGLTSKQIQADLQKHCTTVSAHTILRKGTLWKETQEDTTADTKA